MSRDETLAGKTQSRAVGTGLLLLLAVFGTGAFGQTFVWGILSPDIMALSGASNSQYATAISAAGLAASTFYLFAGLYAARIRPGWLLAASLLLTGAILCEFATTAVSWGGLLANFFLLRVTSRHMLFHAAEMTISANRADLGLFGATLMSAAYPLSLFIVPPTIGALLAFSDLRGLFSVAAAHCLVLGGSTLLVRKGNNAAAAKPDRSALADAFRLLRNTRFLLLAGVYCVTFGLDTAALLFHRTFFEGASSVSLLAVYAAAQVFGTVLANLISRRLSPPNFLWCHLVPLLSGIIGLLLLPHAGPICFFLGLGCSIAMSNYAAVYLWSGEFNPSDFAQAAVLRAFAAASFSALIAISMGKLIDQGATVSALILFSIGASAFAILSVAAYQLLGDPGGAD